MGPISKSSITQKDLVTLSGSYYGDPVFSWKPSLGVTDIEFFNSSILDSAIKTMFLSVILIMVIYIISRSTPIEPVLNLRVQILKLIE